MIYGSALSTSTPPKPGQTDYGSSSPVPTGSSTLTYSCTQSKQINLWPRDHRGYALRHDSTGTLLPPVDPLTDNLAAMAKTNSREIINEPSLLSFLASKQRNILGGLPEGVRHPDADLLQTYVEEGIPDRTGSLWSPQALETSISKGPHASPCNPKTTSFIRG